LTSRDAFDVNIGRVVGEPFSELQDGRITNRLRFRVRNQTADPLEFDFAPGTPSSMVMRVVGAAPVSLEPGEIKRIEVWVIVPREVFSETSIDASFKISFSDGTVLEPVYTLLGPNSN